MEKTFILFDTEYTAWEGSQQRRWSEPWEHREIIQIAALRVRVESGMVEEASFNQYIRPGRNPQLSPYIRALTGITQAVVDAQGIPFTTAFAEFYHFCGEGQFPLFSWGDDPGVLRENCALNTISFPAFAAGFHDIRDVFEPVGIDTTQYTSGTVWQAMGLGFDSAAHDALNDVRSLLVTLTALQQRKRIDPAQLTLGN